MSRVFLALGSNLGDRRGNLEGALEGLSHFFVDGVLEVSPLYETPALLPEHSRQEWNKPFLNLVTSGEVRGEPLHFLRKIKRLEMKLGREDSPRWAPRIIDIDLLLWDRLEMTTDELILPHPSLEARAFVLDPLKDLDQRLKVRADAPSVLELSRNHPQHAPLWMAILNITPDSFSDGGSFLRVSEIEKHLEDIEPHVGIIDLGAESTRPGATLLSWEEEWTRLKPVLECLDARYARRRLKPVISVDTRHAEVARRAVDRGAEIINDVSGLSDPQMVDILRKTKCQYVLMHSLSIPADPKVHLMEGDDAVAVVKDWFLSQLAKLSSMDVALDRIILDPGVGFGKTGLQSLDLLKRMSELTALNHRLLVGHSRKSFIGAFNKNPAAERDLESVGISLLLAQRGVSILRVHNPVAHAHAFLALNHIR